jgi:DNA ligase (NAD+)
MMPKSVLKKINEQRELDWLDPFSNTRNAAAWSIKLLDSGEVKKRKLVCFVYDLLEAEDENWNKIEPDLKDLWFNQVNLPFGKQTIWWIQEICTNSETRQELDQLDYDFDGLVIKLQENRPKMVELTHEEKNQSLFPIGWETVEKSISLRKILWSTQHHPRRAIAYKFPAQQASTQILSVDFQVWRTWIITPVANLQPIQLSGVEISRVSLHNFDFINEKDIKLYDFVWVQRSGEVIPYITSVIKERRNWIEEKISAPLFCPACNSPIINIETHYYCTNPECPAQTKEKLIHFCSKEAMDIQWVGDAIVDILIQQNLIHSVADIYTLSDIQTQIFLKKIPWIWEKTLYEISQQLEESKSKELWRKLNALWIPNIWKKTAQDIEKFLQGKW